MYIYIKELNWDSPEDGLEMDVYQYCGWNFLAGRRRRSSTPSSPSRQYVPTAIDSCSGFSNPAQIVKELPAIDVAYVFDAFCTDGVPETREGWWGETA